MRTKPHDRYDIYPSPISSSQFVCNSHHSPSKKSPTFQSQCNKTRSNCRVMFLLTNPPSYIPPLSGTVQSNAKSRRVDLRFGVAYWISNKPRYKVIRLKNGNRKTRRKPLLLLLWWCVGRKCFHDPCGGQPCSGDFLSLVIWLPGE